jgi:2-methylisocitrate lyase-like PEP mutase family enzyme
VISQSSLRERINRPKIVIAPGAFDAMGARLIEQAGFEAVYMTGAGTAMAHGFPDFGLLDMGEMVTNAARMARSVKVPLIADADTGYGNELNVTRAVREYEMRGVTAIHIEDQVAPKRCGHMEGKEVVSKKEFISKIRAAVEARRSREFLIIARTDARAIHGIEDAIERVREAVAGGADVAFVEAPQSMEEVARIPRDVGAPCLLNVVSNGKTPVVDLREAEAMGYRLAIVPGILIHALIASADRALAELKANHVPPVPMGNPTANFRRFGADEWDALRRRFQ